MPAPTTFEIPAPPIPGTGGPVTVTIPGGRLEDHGDGVIQAVADRYCYGSSYHQYSVSFNRLIKNVRLRVLTPEDTWVNNGMTPSPLYVPLGSTNIFIPGPTSSVWFLYHGMWPQYWMIAFDSFSFEFADPVEEPGKFTFDTPSSTRVLIHNYGSYPYPAGVVQKADGQISVSGTLKDSAGHTLAGKKVYFRIVDPPDSAFYIKAKSYGDNSKGFTPKLNGSTSPVEVTTDGTGKATVLLSIQGAKGGDNFILEASPGDSAFKCGTACAHSVTFEAWKRVYVEVEKMFRRGSLLRKAVHAGETEIEIANVSPFEVEQKVRLIHGSAPDDAASFHDEFATVAAVHRDCSLWDRLVSRPCPGRLVFRSPIEQDYVASELRDGARDPMLADGIGLVDVDNSSTYLLPDPGLMTQAFDPAFVEHVWMMDSKEDDSVKNGVGKGQQLMLWDAPIPFVDNLWNDFDREWFQRKWMRGPNRTGIERSAEDNRHVLLTGWRYQSDDGSLWDLGLAQVMDGFNEVWIFRRHTGAGSLLQEATVHELAHEWLVNPEFLPGVAHRPDDVTHGHCNESIGERQRMAKDSSRACTMTSDLYSSSEASDGVVGFHYVEIDGRIDSEYIRIRERAEPIPQDEVSGRKLR